MGTTAEDLAVSPLTLVAEVAATMGGEADIVRRTTHVLGQIVRSLGASEASLWLAMPSGLVLAARAGAHSTPAELLAEHLEAGSADSTTLLVRPLNAGSRRLGALVVQIERGLWPEATIALTAVAAMLAPALAAAEQARAFQADVERRTRQVDDERRFIHAVVDALPVSLYVVDRDFRITVWNRTRESGSQGVRREAALGKTIFEILHRAPAEKLRTELEEVFRTGRMQQFTMDTRATGAPRTYRITKIPMQTVEGEPISHVITIGEDVTDMAAAQSRVVESQRLGAVGQLAAGVMQEVDAPLSTIRAAADAATAELSRDFPDGAPVTQAALETIRTEVTRCQGRVKGLLDLVRQGPGERTSVSLNALVDQALDILRPQPQVRQVALQSFLDPELPAVLGNAEALTQVILGLLNNAVESIASEGTVTVRTRAAGTPQGGVIVEVIDTGAGIERTEMSRLFEPFYSTKGPGRGIGLGLSSCYAIVSDHGGRLEVDSAVGAGSSFRILLPGVSHP